MSRLRSHLAWMVVLAALVAAWQAYVRLRGVPQYVLPAPTDVGRTLWDERGPLASAAGVTAREMLAGFALALGFGLAAAVALHASATVRRAVYPLLVGSQSVPVVAIAPILVIYLGFGLAPKLVIVALVCFFPITVAALDGFRSVDPEHVRVMRTLRASRTAIFRRVELPWALPSIFTGMRLGLGFAWVVIVVGEMTGVQTGLGAIIMEARQLSRTEIVISGMIVIGAFGFLSDQLVMLVGRRLLTWSPSHG